MMENQLTAAQCLQAGRRAFAQAYNYEAALRAFGQGLKIDVNCNELERAFLSASHSLRLQVYRNVFVRRNGQYWGICELVAPAAQELFQLGKSFFFSGDYLWAIKFFGAALCHDSTNRCLLQYFCAAAILRQKQLELRGYLRYQ